tara:strand:+ start:96 stop:1025 length:930 start_codon:yes stop_codon:yes gene_type:complete
MQGIMSGLEPTPQRNEEEVLKQMLEDRAVLELEDRLGIKIPRSTDESEENLINKVLQITGKPISKKGDEFSYGKDDGLSFYINPKINGAGIRYNKKFADGGIAAFADGGFPDLSGDGKITQKDILMGRGVIKKANGGIVKLQEGGDYKFNAKDLMMLTGLGGLYAARNPERAKGFLKNYIFDYTDPMDYATLPLYAAGPLGGAANKALKARRVAKNIKKASNLEKGLVNPVVSTGIPAGTLTYELDPINTVKNIMSDPEVDTEYYNNPNIAYYNDETDMYFYYDPKDTEEPYRYFEGDIPSGYVLEDVE